MNALHNATRAHETFAGYSQLEVMCCPTCGVLYALPARLLEKARKDPDKWWYCPNGHNLHFPGKTEEDRLRDQLKFERDARARIVSERDQAEQEARVQKGRATRFKNDRDRIKTRTSHGVCPCCNRTFKQLARHMKSQHPSYVEEQVG